MKLAEKNILIVSPESWDHIYVSKHHYARHLAARGNKVYFLNPASRRGNLSISDSSYGVSVIDYPGFMKGLRYMPKFIRVRQVRRMWQKIQSLAQTKIDVIWSFDNSVFYDFDALPKRILKISHIVDLNQNFQFEKAVKSADISIAVTSIILNKMKSISSRSFLITHGLSIPKNANETLDLVGNNKIKALYVGNLAMNHFDWHVVFQAVLQCPDVDFIFIGPGANEIDMQKNVTAAYKANVLSEKNCYFLGKKPSEEVLSYMKKADLLWISYQEKHHIDQTNSHKIMEYLYSGRPVVATYTADYDGLDLISMSQRNEDWPALLQHTIENLDSENTPEKITARKAFALNNTYDKQIDRIEEIISRVCK